MGLYFARSRRTIGDEPSASITWREYVAALSAATDPGDVWHGGDGGDRRGAAAHPAEDGMPNLAHGQGGPAIGPLEIALRLVRRRAERAVGFEDALQLQCEAARLRLLLIRLYMRLGDVDRAGALAQESQDVL